MCEHWLWTHRTKTLDRHHREISLPQFYFYDTVDAKPHVTILQPQENTCYSYTGATIWLYSSSPINRFYKQDFFLIIILGSRRISFLILFFLCHNFCPKRNRSELVSQQAAKSYLSRLLKWNVFLLERYFIIMLCCFASSSSIFFFCLVCALMYIYLVFRGTSHSAPWCKDRIIKYYSRWW